MKKAIIRAFFAILILAILALVVGAMFLDSVVKKGVETVGPMLTGVSIRLDSVKLSLLSGSGKFEGLVVGNPQGYSSPSAINIGSASCELNTSSLLADKLVIKSINVQAPEITLETDMKNNNLSKILSNLEESSGGKKAAQSPESAKAQKKLQVDDFVINGGKIHVLVTPVSGSATVPCPTIHLTDLGKGPDGITAAELTELVLKEICNKATAATTTAVADIEKGGIHMSGDVGHALGTNGLDKATKGLGDLLKKK